MMTTDGIELPTVDTLTMEKATRLDWTPLTVSVMLTATRTSKVRGTTVVSNVNDEPVEVYCELAANAACASWAPRRLGSMAGMALPGGRRDDEAVGLLEARPV